MKTFQFQKLDIDYFYDYHTIVDMPFYKIDSIGNRWYIESCLDNNDNDKSLKLTRCQLENIHGYTFNLLKDEKVFIYVDDKKIKWIDTKFIKNKINI